MQPITPEVREFLDQAPLGRASVEAETVLQTLRGERLTVLFTITFPAPSGRFDSVLVTVTDITARKQAEYLAGQVFETSPDSMFILAQGRVGIYDDSAGGTGARDHLATLEAPSYFGETGLLTGQARGATIIAENEVLCYRLDKAGFDAIVRARAELIEPMSKVVVARQSANDAKLQALSADARQAYADFAAAWRNGDARHRLLIAANREASALRPADAQR